MSLQLITGGASKARSRYVLEEIKSMLLREPTGKPIFYIVPEQMTFQQEYGLFTDDELKGSTRAQVVSFSRLAWRVLQETGGSTRRFISSTGTQMMLRKIIEQRTGEGFHVFQKAADKHGFLKELDGMITEFKRHCVTPDGLKEYLDYTNENKTLQYKLMDLHYIYDELMQLFADKYIDGEDQLSLLTEKIPDTPFFTGAEVFIDGFHRFTPNELGIITELLKVCNKVSIVLTTEHVEADDAMTELDLFYQTNTTYHQLKQLAQENDLLAEADIVLDDNFDRYTHAPYVKHLEKHFDDRPAPALKSSETNPIHLYEAVHPRAEIDGVIQEILRLTRDENYRYRDMVIYLRDASLYNDLIQTMFHDYDIPVYIDAKKTMLHHSFIEFIRSLFDVIESNWRYDAIFRLLKTGYIKATDDEYPLNRNAIDVLENYVLEYGIRSKSLWVKDEQWKFQRFRGFDAATQIDYEKEQEIKINAYRRQIVQAIGGFADEINKLQTPREYCELLFLLLEELGIAEQLEAKRAEYDEEGRVEEAREQEQVWHAVVQLMDEMVEMIGDEEMDFKLFKTTFEAGIEALEFSHVPPTIDHVIVGSIDHSRIDNKKCSFLIGVNEGYWPLKPPVDGMINEQEREFLSHFGMELAASNRRVLLDDLFYMYLAFTTATEYMFVSYPISDNEGSTRLPSQMIKRLGEFFPDLKQPVLLSDPDELKEAARFITTPAMTRSPLTVQFSRYIRGYPLAPIWRDVLAWYIEHEAKHSTAYKVLQSLFYRNEPVSLNEKTVQQLYPKDVKTSVSRLEMLYSCSYKHFAQYNLKLENRRTYTLDAPDIGQLFHEALKTITEWIQQEGHDFKAITKSEAKSYADRSVQQLAPVLQHQILSSSNRYKYLQKKLTEIIAKATYILSEQARLSGFSPVGIELNFGMDKGLAPLKMDLPNGYTLLLRGRIDRVDEARDGEHLYLRIIDYKSSDQSLSLERVYYGLSLQMLVYLQVVLSQAEEWLGMKAEPGGVLYFHIHDALLKEKNRISDDDIEEKLFKKYKMKGLVTADETVARLMDTSLDTGYSDIVPLALNRSGGFYKNSSVASTPAFEMLGSYLNQLIVHAGLSITSGEIQLNPYQDKQTTACQFCDFKSVCQFDPILKENKFHRLSSLKEEEIFHNIEKRLEKGGDLKW